MSAASVLAFHDALELFLHVVALHLDARASERLEFRGYFDLEGVRDRVKHSGLALQVNQARVAVKHRGVTLAQRDVAECEVWTRSFLQDNTKVFFQLDFVELSLLDYVQPEVARVSLGEALDLAGKGDFDEALGRTAIAFQQVVDDYRGRKKDGMGRSVLDLRWQRHRSIPNWTDDRTNICEAILSHDRNMEELRDAVEVLCLGLNYRQHALFRAVTPLVVQTMDGKYHLGSAPHPEGMRPESPDVLIQKCVDHVVETALTLQQDDYDISFRWMEPLT
ncbi:MAG TPA: hypothetical protein VMH22_09310 [bacterium]|nr:hypothetical protein [bacterium]